MDRDIHSLEGHIYRNHGGTIVLGIYSKPLAMAVIERHQKVSLTPFADGLLIEPNGPLHVTIAAKKRLQIAATKLLREIFDGNVPETIPIYVCMKTWGLSELLRHATGSPLTTIFPTGLVAKRAAIKQDRNRFYIDVSSKGLGEVARRSLIRCMLARDGENFIMIKANGPKARKLTSHTKGRRVQISIPKTMLTDEELKLLAKKGWLGGIKLKFALSTFGISDADFYTVKEEKELVNTLTDMGIRVSPKDARSPYDIGMENHNSYIEVHNSTSSHAELKSRHNIRMGQVRLRILEAQYLANNPSVNHAFVVVNESWIKSKHVVDLVSNLNHKTHVLSTDFKDGWAKKIARTINDIVCSKPLQMNLAGEITPRTRPNVSLKPVFSLKS